MATGANQNACFDTLYRGYHRSPIPSFSTYDSQYPSQAGLARPSTQPDPSVASTPPPGVGPVTESGKSEGLFARPIRNVRSQLGMGFDERSANRQPTIQIPPIRSMRSTRTSSLGQAPLRFSPSQNSIAEHSRPRQKIRNAAGRVGALFGQATGQVRELTLPATLRRQDGSGSPKPRPLFGEGVEGSSHFVTGDPLPATNRRHAMYRPLSPERCRSEKRLFARLECIERL